MGSKQDSKLEGYRRELVREYGEARIPDFNKGASCESKVLILLHDPGNSGATISGRTSPTNKDPTSKKQREMLCKYNINSADLIFWNLYAAFDIEDIKYPRECTKREWASHIQGLISILENLKMIMICGAGTRKDFNQAKLIIPSTIKKIYAPLPSPRGMMVEDAQEKLEEAWQCVQNCLK